MSTIKKSLVPCTCPSKRVNGGVCTCEIDLTVEVDDDEKEEEEDADNNDSSFSDDILNRPSI